MKTKTAMEQRGLRLKRSILTAVVTAALAAFAQAAHAESSLTAAPQPPLISGSDPDSPANDNYPSIRGAAELGSTVTLYRSSDCSGGTAARGSALQFWFKGLDASVPDNSVTSFTATATSSLGETSSCSAPLIYREVTYPATPPRHKKHKRKRKKHKKNKRKT